MKRTLYVCLFLAIFITTPLAAQSITRSDRVPRTRDIITAVSRVPAGAWEHFIVMLEYARGVVRMNGVLSEPPGDDGTDETVNGVLSEPPGEEEEPPPPPPAP